MGATLLAMKLTSLWRVALLDLARVPCFRSAATVTPVRRTQPTQTRSERSLRYVPNTPRRTEQYDALETARRRVQRETKETTDGTSKGRGDRETLTAADGTTLIIVVNERRQREAAERIVCRIS